MPDIPAVCNNCGSLYPSGTGFDAGGTGVNVTFIVPSGPAGRLCPVCGANGRQLGGAWDIVENTIQLLEGPEQTVADLEKLAGILRKARDQNADFEEVKSSIEQEFPTWGQQLTKLLVPKAPADIAAYIMLALMVVQTISQAKQAEGPMQIKADQIINNITVETPAPTSQLRITTVPRGAPNDYSGQVRASRKVVRNEPCPCGSGKKFKKCHGADGQTRYEVP